MPELTFEQFMIFVAFVLGCIAAYNAIMTAIKNHNEMKKVKESPVAQ